LPLLAEMRMGVEIWFPSILFCTLMVFMYSVRLFFQPRCFIGYRINYQTNLDKRWRDFG
jgi:hypothetical protein